MKVLIVEDELPISLSMRALLCELRPSIEIVGIATSISDSVRMISSHPDLDIIFSDIKLDDGLSFSVFDKVSTDAIIIFTTAYDEFALKAFDYNCVDYLMKPVSKDSLERALTKCEKHISKTDSFALKALAEEIRSQKLSYRKKILLERGSEILVCDVCDVCYIFSEKGDTRAFLDNGSWGSVDCSLVELSKSLSSKVFFRVNRQAIINIEFLNKIAPGPGRDSIILLKAPYDKQQFLITQERKKELLDVLSGFSIDNK